MAAPDFRHVPPVFDSLQLGMLILDLSSRTPPPLADSMLATFATCQFVLRASRWQCHAQQSALVTALLAAQVAWTAMMCSRLALDILARS